MITVDIDSHAAIARFGRSGIPEQVRRNLRAVIPDLTKKLGAQVERNLDAGLKSRTSLTVKKEMVESTTDIYGRVVTVSSKIEALPLWLEEGTKAHEIAARNAKALYFFWGRIGAYASFKKVMHPGFPGIHYSSNAFKAMEDEITMWLNQAVINAVLEERSRAGYFTRVSA